jgi:hypothetical protein
MTIIAERTVSAISENNFDEVIFQDPFSDVTRKAKRNLLVASFAGLLIVILKLQVTGFLGLQASTGVVGNDLTQGLICIVVTFFLISFLFHTYIDYSAWQFQRERLQTKPYLELITTIQHNFQVTGEQVKNAVFPLNQPYPEKHSEMTISTIQSQLNSIEERLAELRKEINPLLDSWRKTISSIERLEMRLKLRFASLWVIDICLPVSLSLLAIYKSHSEIYSVLLKLLN